MQNSPGFCHMTVTLQEMYDALMAHCSGVVYDSTTLTPEGVQEMGHHECLSKGGVTDMEKDHVVEEFRLAKNFVLTVLAGREDVFKVTYHHLTTFNTRHDHVLTLHYKIKLTGSDQILVGTHPPSSRTPTLLNTYTSPHQHTLQTYETTDLL